MPLVVEGDSVRLASFRGVEQNAEAARALEQARALMREAALQGVTENVLVEHNGGDAKSARALLALMVRRADVVKSGDLEQIIACIRGVRDGDTLFPSKT